MNVILCGMMGVGKTAVGQRLAQKLGRRWVDTDVLIEEKYGEIAAIFERFGEEYFRGLETEIVAKLVQEDGLVISVPGFSGPEGFKESGKEHPADTTIKTTDKKQRKALFNACNPFLCFFIIEILL